MAEENKVETTIEIPDGQEPDDGIELSKEMAPTPEELADEGIIPEESVEPEKPAESKTPEGETEEGGEPKDVKPDEEPDGVQKKINKFYREKMEAEEREAAERTKRIELETKLKEATAVELPEIPVVPEYLDPEYDAKMRARDEIIIKHAQAQANEEALAKVQAERVVEEQTKENERIQGMITGFDTRTTELGLSKQALIDSQNVVGKALTGKHEIAQYLLSDENGPLNVLYLSQNTEELDKVCKMPTAAAAVHIATKIAPEAIKLKPNTTNAPKVPYTPEGGRSKVESEDPNLEGCTFE